MRFASDEIRRRYAEFAKEYADTPQGRTIASWLSSTEPKPEAPKVAEIAKPEAAKPETSKPENSRTEIPKPPEPAPAPPVAKPPEPVRVEPVVKPPPSSRRPSTPDKTKLDEAEAAVRKSFPIDQAKTSKAKADLARTLLQRAISGTRNEEFYVLLRMAQDLAAQGLDAKTAIESIDARAAAFDVDAMAEKVELFAKTNALGQNAVTWARASLEVAQQAVEAEEYDSALRLSERAEGLARGTNDRVLLDLARQRSREFTEFKREAEKARPSLRTLETKPDDPEANGIAGRFMCFFKDDWDRGLPMLAKGSDLGLKKLAEQDLSWPSTAVPQAAVGEAWAAQAEKESSGGKARVKARAAMWLDRAIPGLSGPAKALAERKRVSLGPASLTKNLRFLDLGDGSRIELVYVRSGVFTMGGVDAPVLGWEIDERPEHRIEISKGYYLGRVKVTRGMFAVFVKATGYKTDAEKVGRALGSPGGGAWAEMTGLNWQSPNFAQTDDHPVICVSWNDAKAFCDWASKKTGRGVRLPTEAEWEYACRAGTRTRWSFGDDEARLGDYGWYGGNAGGQTHPLGQKMPNAWSLYDTHGNAWEWCEDWAGPYQGDATDPTGPTAGDRRLLRGGGWHSQSAALRSAFRCPDDPAARSSDYGFRVAVSATSP